MVVCLSRQELQSELRVEARGERSETVYANVVCPGRREIWYTLGGYPAASAGNWQRIEWPWLVVEEGGAHASM